MTLFPILCVCTVVGQIQHVHIWEWYWNKILTCGFLISFLLTNCQKHLCTSRLVVKSLYTPECGPQRPFLTEFTLCLLALTGWRFHRTRCSAPRMLLPALPALAPPAPLPGLYTHSSLHLVAWHLCHNCKKQLSLLNSGDSVCFVTSGFLINSWLNKCSK